MRSTISAEVNSSSISELLCELRMTSTTPYGLDFFYAPPEAVTGSRIHITGDEFSHLTHVMRRQEGDQIGILDGVGTCYVGVIVAIEKRTAFVDIQSIHPLLNESPRRVTLGVSLLKNPSRFDYLVEKATEAGVRTILPMICARTIPRHARVDRWQKIALAATKQCGRCIIPTILEPVPFPDFLKTPSGNAQRLVLHERAGTVWAAGANPSVKLDAYIGVGPEGGFTDLEVSEAEQHAFDLVRLGERRLRTETAAIFAAARLLLYESL
jgi:16S rRNA (uracil1498-N3)-methyltransferase